jgi:FkbM family methyltransferase
MKSKIRFILISVICAFILITYQILSVVYIRHSTDWNSKFIDPIEQKEIKKFLTVYNMSKRNLNKFDCIRTVTIIVNTKICLHNISEDVYVSKSLKVNGIWEPHLTKIFMKLINSRSSIQVIDIGAHIGQFTLLAASLGRTVIAVEPFYENYIRLHKAALLDFLTDQIILVTNAVSDKRGEIKKLIKNDKNIGGKIVSNYYQLLNILNKFLTLKGQGINVNDETDYSTMVNSSLIENNPYYVRTIYLDDIITVLPNDFHEAIIKIDIENYELKAFRRAAKLFDRLKIRAVFMEWRGKRDKDSYLVENVDQFLDFMYSRNFFCTNANGLLRALKRETWRYWPDDIVWMHSSFRI